MAQDDSSSKMNPVLRAALELVQAQLKAARGKRVPLRPAPRPMASSPQNPMPGDVHRFGPSNVPHSPENWRSGSGYSVKIGYINPNGQRCHGHRGVPGTDHGQYSYRVECTSCANVYGANGSDVHERKCPKCQGGAPGLDF